ncbi:MAG: polyprenyl synthetase family protein [Chloroflexi bacterium]|nr:polyprenyl synthetase family protein [Chloroflexota bacterium]
MVGNNLTTVNLISPIQELMPLVEARMQKFTKSYPIDFRVALEKLLVYGGKRIRPKLNLLVGRMLNANSDQLITSAAAIELLHTATLVHDDLIDGALFRRGTPTLNSSWNAAKTVLAGDLLFSHSAKLAAETGSLEIIRLFADTLATIVNGEVTQLFEKSEPTNPEKYYRRIYAKTASLFEAATKAAAYLSPVDEDVIDAVSMFGREIGMAFQIVDDVLDFTGKQSTVGKPVASDLRQGLITLPVFYYIESHPNDPAIEKSLNMVNGGLADDAITERLVESIRDSGAIERALEEARRYSERGIRALEELPANNEQGVLIELALELTERKS